MTLPKCILTCFAIPFFLTFCSVAQQTAPALRPQSTPPEPKQEDPKDSQKPQSGSQGQTVPGSSSPQGKVEGTSNDRLFFALPNFLSLENGGKVAALTTKQKFSVVARTSFDYSQ